MKTALIVAASLIGVMTLFVVLTVGIWVSSINGEARARNAFIAQAAANEAAFDRQWKTITQMAQVPVADRKSFKDTYTAIMTATRGVAGNGQLASFFTQAKIDVPPDLFRQLMTTIESQRMSFYRDQQKLTELKRNHDNIRTTYPSAFFVGGAPELTLKLVTSSRTSEAFATGNDDDVSLPLEEPKAEKE